MAAPAAPIRSACDRCHQKKVRCILGRNRDICNRCAEHRIACIFSPPGRNGRPPRNQSSSDRAPSQAPLLTPQSWAFSGNSDELSAPLAGVNKPANDTSSHSHVENVTLAADPFSTSLEDTWTLEDNLLDRLNSVEPQMLDMNGEIDSAPPTHNEDPMIGGFFPTIPGSMPGTSESFRNRDQQNTGQMNATPEPLSASETLRLLHIVQQRLLEESSKNGLSMSSSPTRASSKKLDLGTFFQSIEEMHDVVNRYFDGLSQAGTKFPCDFSTAMALATTMGNAVEVYELIARFSARTPSTASSRTKPHQRNHSSRLSFSHHRPSIHPLGNAQHMTEAQHLEDSHIACGLEASSISQVRIGSFTPSDDVARRILADVLLYQMSVSQKLLNQLRQHLVQAESPSFLSSSVFSTGSSLSNGDPNSTQSSAISFFTPELHLTVVHLLNQLQTRIGKLELVTLDSTALNSTG
uniref:CapM n=1 Tax=Capnodium sp. TTI-000886 TaxID=3078996 RepID=A0AA96S0C1_9PEZI|nr:CapM [Capnodium sp. TTI-000886]